MRDNKVIGYAYDSMWNATSLEKQKQKIEQYCRDQGYELLFVYEVGKEQDKEKIESFKNFLQKYDVENINIVVVQMNRITNSKEGYLEVVELLKAKNSYYFYKQR